MNTELKIISLLLSYPNAELLSNLSGLRSALDASSPTTKHICKALDDLGQMDLYDAQERYVFLFDRTRSLSLHLFEHVHGESRDRGQAMVDLMAMYERGGLDISKHELPDYLPLFLEYLVYQSPAEIQDLLGQTLHIISAMRERLKTRKSVYAELFRALEKISKTKPDAKLLKALLSEAEDDPNDLQALDDIWEEEVITFGGGAGENACGPDRLQRQIRAANRPPQDGSLNSTPQEVR